MPSKELELEERVRLTLHLPFGSRGEVKAFRQIIFHLDQMKGQGEEAEVTGYTFSDPVYHGYWRDSEIIYYDKISLLFSDFHIRRFQDREKVDNLVERLHQLVVDRYNANGRRQKEFWIIVQPLTRYAKQWKKKRAPKKGPSGSHSNPSVLQEIKSGE